MSELDPLYTRITTSCHLGISPDLETDTQAKIYRGVASAMHCERVVYVLHSTHQGVRSPLSHCKLVTRLFVGCSPPPHSRSICRSSCWLQTSRPIATAHTHTHTRGEKLQQRGHEFARCLSHSDLWGGGPAWIASLLSMAQLFSPPPPPLGRTIERQSCDMTFTTRTTIKVRVVRCKTKKYDLYESRTTQDAREHIDYVLHMILHVNLEESRVKAK